MAEPAIHGKRRPFTASNALQSLADALTRIKSEDGLTWAELGLVLGKSNDQAAKYADGSATMDVVTFGRAKREWNGRFTGGFDRLCEQSRPVADSDRGRECKVLKAALALSIALDGDDTIDAAEVRANLSTIQNARDALDALLAKVTTRGEA